ncbi:MAG: (d)CMP kinase [Firmicutes bacterium]|nr:(d)CMP kinase [Bacillota bacterium]
MACLIRERGQGVSTIRVAIDGPAGAGKSTVAKALAQRLGLQYVDTGAMYRAVAWAAIQRNIPLEDEERISELATSLEFSFTFDKGQLCVSVNGIEVTPYLRTPEVSRGASVVAQYKGVRQALGEQQKRLAQLPGIVMDGRDIGSRIMPNGDLKVYLTASPEVRARRRWEEIGGSNQGLSLAKVAEEIRRRDQADQQRKSDPLVPAADAVVIDTSTLSLAQVVDRLVHYCEALCRTRAT